MKENNKYELIKFKDGEFELDVNVSPEEKAIWMTIAEISSLFERDQSVIGKHIRNIFNCGELDENTSRQILPISSNHRPSAIYNLSVILMVGYRVNGHRGEEFRKWSNTVLSEYILNGAVINQNRCLGNPACINNFLKLENEILELKKSQNKSLTLKETDHIDAMFMLEEILKSAKHRLVIVDNYFDHSFDEILLHSPAKVVVITHPKNESFDSDKYEVIKVDKFHDRYLFVDDKAYHFGESFNKLGTDISTCDYIPNFSLENFLEISGLKI